MTPEEMLEEERKERLLSSAEHVIGLAQMGCGLSNALPGYGCDEGPIDKRQIEDILTIEKLLIKELRSQGIAVDMLRSQEYWDKNLDLEAYIDNHKKQRGPEGADDMESYIQ
jgi:hypothetical protein